MPDVGRLVNRGVAVLANARLLPVLLADAHAGGLVALGADHLDVREGDGAHLLDDAALLVLLGAPLLLVGGLFAMLNGSEGSSNGGIRVVSPVLVGVGAVVAVLGAVGGPAGLLGMAASAVSLVVGGVVAFFVADDDE